MRLDQAGIRAFRKEHILFAILSDKSGTVLARANAFADIERRLSFPEARLDVKVDNGLLIVTTHKFARAVHLEGDFNGNPFGWFFEDNYFDLLPGEVKTVRILGQHRQGRALGSLAGSFKQFMGEITQMERQVRASPTMTPEKKREYLDAVRQTKIKVAESVRDSVRAASDRKTSQASPA